MFKISTLGLTLTSTATIILFLTLIPVAYAQNPFTFGNTGDPFSLSGGSSSGGSNNAVIHIITKDSWQGNYGDISGQNSIDGHGNKDISFTCSNIYSAVIQKKSDGDGTLTVSISGSTVEQNSKTTNSPFGVVSISGQC